MIGWPVLDLVFRIEDVVPGPLASTPLVALCLSVRNSAGPQVQSVLLRCQVQIDAPARAYEAGESEQLQAVFGKGRVWGRALGRVLWTHATVVVPRFDREARFEIHAPCSHEQSASWANYLRGVQQGDVPVAVLFSGTVLYTDADGRLQAAPIPWSSEARFMMPLGVWRQALDNHYGDVSPLVVRRALMDRLHRYSARVGSPTIEDAIERLLPPEPLESGRPS